MAARFGSVSRTRVGNIGALSRGLAGRTGGADAVPSTAIAWVMSVLPSGLGPSRRRAHNPLPATDGGSDSQDRSWQAPRRKDACLSAIICKVTCQYVVT